MSVIARRPSRTFTPAPEGLHAAVCVDVQNLGLVQGAWGPKHKVRLVWQLEGFDEERGRRFEVARLYTLSLGERAALRKDLESWRGRKFTEVELEDGFDLEKLLGVNAQVQITHDLSDDGAMYANVTTVLPPVKGTPKLAAHEFVRLKDRAQARGNVNTNGRRQEVDHVPF